MSARPPRWGWSRRRRLALGLLIAGTFYALVGALLVWALGLGCSR